MKYLLATLTLYSCNIQQSFLAHHHVISDTHLARMIELSQTPVNQPQSSVFMINHNIVRLHIPVHDPHTVTVVQSPQQLVKIKPVKNIFLFEC